MFDGLNHTHQRDVTAGGWTTERTHGHVRECQQDIQTYRMVQNVKANFLERVSEAILDSCVVMICQNVT